VGEAATRCPVILHMLRIGATQCYHEPLKSE
jgi:hypothetical protein